MCDFASLRIGERIDQRGAAVLFQPKRVGEGSDFFRQFLQLAFLTCDRFAQHELDHHEDRKDEHQDQQKPRHRIHEPRPDRGVEPLRGPPGECHSLAPRLDRFGEGRKIAAQICGGLLTASGKFF